jgi:hypothetical protein
VANDRMYVVHKITKNKACIAKHYGDGWYAPNNVEDRLNGLFDDTLLEFFQDPHAYEIVFELSTFMSSRMANKKEKRCELSLKQGSMPVSNLPNKPCIIYKLTNGTEYRQYFEDSVKGLREREDILVEIRHTSNWVDLEGRNINLDHVTQIYPNEVE